MAHEREGAEGPRRSPASKDRIRSGGSERYPAVDQTDAVVRAVCAREVPSEPRSFDPSADAPTPRYAGNDLPASTSDGRLGPQGDPAEGSR
jgi:hypothetical protein